MTPEALAVEMSNFINSSGTTDFKEFVEAMGDEHRTLQQAFTKVTLMWLAHLAELPEHGYDGRNEHSVVVARQVRGLLKTKYGSSWTNMPCV